MTIVMEGPGARKKVSVGTDKNSIYLQALDIEHELRVRRNARHALATVPEARRNSDSPLAADGDAFDANVPALDDFAGAELEGEGLALFVCWCNI